MVDALNQFSSNQRLLRSQRKSANTQLNTFNPTVDVSTRFITDSQDVNFLSPTTRFYYNIHIILIRRGVYT
ncbi:unnamed protein product [Adineta steineri]|uniref:Uncharacterized protein n=1 Tax=Adineta steineri TaxID=433720 RepID=A0A813TQ63_9BILA|nr:unnamed protein product [Adineta steineri]